MSDAEGFLARWSRRKGEAQKVANDSAPVENSASSHAPVPETAPDEPEAFDLSSLPSIDGITATSDISPFLKTGVPDALRNAALRQVWQTDPAIRDYIGPADYDWDFHTPGALAGHGELAADIDIGKLIDQFTNAIPKTAPDRNESVARSDGQDLMHSNMSQAHLNPPPGGGSEPITPESADEMEPMPIRPVEKKKRHGGALPRYSSSGSTG